MVDAFHETVPIQSETRRGAMPSRRPGTPIRSVQATTSLGRLISTSKLPASENSDRRFVLDASSSISPSRGSMIGFIGRLPYGPPATQAGVHIGQSFPINHPKSSCHGLFLIGGRGFIRRFNRTKTFHVKHFGTIGAKISKNSHTSRGSLELCDRSKKRSFARFAAARIELARGIWTER
jgi:hypothetical protein